MSYDDIVDLPHFKASGRGQMSLHDRAAQFMPFKSLKGYDELIDESADRLNSETIHWTKNEKDYLGDF